MCFVFPASFWNISPLGREGTPCGFTANQNLTHRSVDRSDHVPRQEHLTAGEQTHNIWMLCGSGRQTTSLFRWVIRGPRHWVEHVPPQGHHQAGEQTFIILNLLIFFQGIASFALLCFNMHAGHLTSHVTVSGVWREEGKGVTCYGFWGLGGEGKRCHMLRLLWFEWMQLHFLSPR